MGKVAKTKGVKTKRKLDTNIGKAAPELTPKKLRFSGKLASPSNKIPTENSSKSKKGGEWGKTLDKVTKRTKAVVQQHDVGINNNATLIQAVVNSTGKDDSVKLKQDGSRSRPSTSVPKEVPTEVPAMSDSERAGVYFLQGEEPNTTPKSREKTPKKNQRVFGGKSLHNRSNRSTQGDDHDGIDLNVDPSDDNFREDTSDEESSDGSSSGSDSNGDGSYLSDGDYSSGQEVNVANAVMSNSLGGREDLKKLLRENQDVQDLVKDMVAEEVKEQMPGTCV